MDNTEIAISLDRKTLERMDGLIRERSFPAAAARFRRPWPRSSRAMERGRLASEGAKLDLTFEKALAGEGEEAELSNASREESAPSRSAQTHGCKRPQNRAFGLSHRLGKAVNQTVGRYLLERREEIAQICARLGVRRLELFGSAATGSGQPGDLDFLVDLGDLPPREYADGHFRLLEALTDLFTVPVDLLTQANLGNPYFRERVEQQKTLLYAA
jgi:predicted nucleotidyltransferase